MCKNNDNYVDEILVKGSNENLVVNHLTSPELHLMEGVTNHIHKGLSNQVESAILPDIEKQLTVKE